LKESCFSKALCETIIENFHNMDLISIINKVESILAESCRQKIRFLTTMKKLCFFTLKKKESNMLILSSESKKKTIPSSNLPMKISNFIGRLDVLNNIKYAFNKENKQIVILKSSKSGTGKSSIANKYGWELTIDDSAIVYWINCDDIDLEYKGFAEKFGIFLDDFHEQEEDIIRYTNYKIESTGEKFLFIFDYCEKIEEILKYIKNMPNNAKVLITTNNDLNISEIAKPTATIYLKPFNKREIESFIKTNLTQLDDNVIKYIFDLVLNSNSTKFNKNEEIRPYSLNKFVSLFNLLHFSSNAQNKNSKESIISKESIYYFYNEYIINKSDILDALSKKENYTLEILFYLSFMHFNFIPVEMIKQIANVDKETLEKLTSTSFISIEYIDLQIGLKVNRILKNEIKETFKRNQSLKDKIIENLEDYLKSIFNKKIILKNMDFPNVKKIINNLNEYLGKESNENVLINFSNYCFEIKQYDLALEFYNKFLQLSIDLDENQLVALNNIGIIYCKKRNYELALENLEKALGKKKLFFDSDQNQSVAETMNNIGLVYHKKSDFDSALKYFNESLEIKTKLLSTAEIFSIEDTLNNIGLVYSSKGNYELALDNFKDSLNKKRKFFDNMTITDENVCLSIAETLNNIGLVYNKLASYDLALENFNQSLNFKRLAFGKNENDLSLTETFNNIGLIYLKQGKYESALEKFNKSLQICRLIFGSDENSYVASALNNIGLAYNSQGKFDLAMQNCDKSLGIYRLLYGSSNNLSTAKILNDIGLIYCSQGRYESALKNLENSLRIKRKAADEKQSIADTLNNIGLVYSSKGNYELALESFNESLGIVRSVFGEDLSEPIAKILNNIGLVYHKIRDYDLALKFYKDSLRISRLLFDTYDSNQSITNTLKNIQSVYYKQRNN
jgi:tetratricopeptide (TPR) repeat protein